MGRRWNGRPEAPSQPRTGRSRPRRAVVVLLSALAVVGAAAGRFTIGGSGSASLVAWDATGLPEATVTELRAAPSASPSATAPATSSTPTTSIPGLTVADRAAGLRSTDIPQHGTGHLVVVPGSPAAPGTGTVKRVRVEVEQGLAVDGADFADFVLDTLNDPRGWGHGGRMRFARTSGATDLRVVLASPRTSMDLCAPLQTKGTLSCGKNSTAVLTLYRWVKATPDYGDDRTGYRRYLVNHEVGHTLGHHHEKCAGRGALAPVMMQQTKGLKGCRPNSWPYP